MKKCPYCGAPVEFGNFDDEFTSFVDCGNYIIASGKFDCQCGESITIRANFIWDENFEIE